MKKELASHQQQVAGGGGRRLQGSEEGKGQQLKVGRTGRVLLHQHLSCISKYHWCHWHWSELSLAQLLILPVFRTNRCGSAAGKATADGREWVRQCACRSALALSAAAVKNQHTTLPPVQNRSRSGLKFPSLPMQPATLHCIASQPGLTFSYLCPPCSSRICPSGNAICQRKITGNYGSPC